MRVDNLVVEILLQDRIASRRGVEALLAFWRVWQHVIPEHANIHQPYLDYLEHASQPPASPYWEEESSRFLPSPVSSVQPEIEQVYRRRELWDRVLEILELPDATEAAHALEQLVNGPDAVDMTAFYIGFDPGHTGATDPAYIHYKAAFYEPFRRRLRWQQATAIRQARTA